MKTIKLVPTLDEWDCRLISDFKWSTSANPTTLESLKAIWAERCDLDIEYVHITDITEHLLDIIFQLNLLDNGYLFREFITSLHPTHNWKFVCRSNHYSKDETDYNLILLSRIDSLLSLTEVDKLNGYKEYLISIGE